MKSHVEVVETIAKKEIHRITLTNDHGVSISLLTLGATWQEFMVPKDDSSFKNIILGFDKPSDYLSNGLCAGQSIGRVAGRIDKGQVFLDGQTIQLPQNENGNCLHGGPNGFHRNIWDYTLEEGGEHISVKMTYEARENHDGFPGDIKVSVSYTLTQDNDVIIRFRGENGEKRTLFNPTNHVYVNLGESQDLGDHDLYLNSSNYLETRDDLIPTGNILSVSGTHYDFRQPKNLGDAIIAQGGFDTAFLVNPSLIQKNGELRNCVTGESLAFYSDRNAWVIYTMGGIPNGIYPARDHGKEAREFEAIALEGQLLPDAVHHDNFGNTILGSHQAADYTIRFSYHKG